MPFEFERVQEINGLIVITPQVFEDDRGFFMESYHSIVFNKAGIMSEFVQDNHSRSVKGVIRGLHFQKEPFAQAKLVRCIRGEIFDVAVDLRKDSPSFSKWFGLLLSEENKKMLYIPRGFAHGFATLSSVAEVLYKADNFYSGQHERGIRYDDPSINISWSISSPIVSKKDMELPFLQSADL
jgi:dTDP-4-dehydrorhamnose 3,5-epimerase